MTSSADPEKLKSYAKNLIPSTDPLGTKARDVSEAVVAWNRMQAGYGYARIDYVPQVDGSYGPRLTALVADMRHLDEFVDDVADGFIAAVKQGSSAQEGRLRVVGDDTLARLGVGFADRQEATAAGRQAALDLQRMIDRGLRPADLEAMLRRGRHDPAFAIAFSEQLGVRGYVNAVGAIRMAYGEHNKVPVAGVQAAQALATTLTTALGTRVAPPGGGAGPAAAPDGGAHISPKFIADLAGDFDPMGYGGHDSGAKYIGPDAETDMSVLLRLSNPPPDIARRIGEVRLKSILARTAARNPALADQLRNAAENYQKTYGSMPEKVGTPGGSAAGLIGLSLDQLMPVLTRNMPPLGINDNYVMDAGAYRGWGNAAATGTGPEFDRPDLGGVITNYTELMKRYPELRSAAKQPSN